MKRITTGLIALCLSTGMALAETNAPQAPALDDKLFPPDMVMRLQREIELSEAQSARILEAVRTTQSEMIDVQWSLNPELQALSDTLAQPRIDEADVRARLSTITALEAKAKELQLLLMVRVKNALTPAQQEKLRERAARDRRAPRAPRADRDPR